jgi:hypothetical protein
MLNKIILLFIFSFFFALFGLSFGAKVQAGPFYGTGVPRDNPSYRGRPVTVVERAGRVRTGSYFPIFQPIYRPRLPLGPGFSPDPNAVRRIFVTPPRGFY